MVTESAPPPAAALQVEAVLDLVLASATRLFEADSGSIMLRVGTDELEVVTSPANPMALGARVRFGEGVAGKVAASGDAVLVSGRAGGRSKPVDSGMSVPLVDGGRPFGVLNINARHVRMFTEFDLMACTTFAAHAADALTSARKYEVDRRDGVNRPDGHLTTMLRHLHAAASVEFVPPVPDDHVDVAAIARSIAAAEGAAGRPTGVQTPESAFMQGRSRDVRRLLQELIDNAHRHGATPVRVDIECVDGRMSITIADGGRGIPPEERTRVFEPYVRLVGDTDSEGIGLGLTIARRLAVAIAGTLDIIDIPDGASVLVGLPAAKGASPA